MECQGPAQHLLFGGVIKTETPPDKVGDPLTRGAGYLVRFHLALLLRDDGHLYEWFPIEHVQFMRAIFYLTIIHPFTINTGT